MAIAPASGGGNGEAWDEQRTSGNTGSGTAGTGGEGIVFLRRYSRSMKKWICTTCGFIYDEAAGIPDQGIAPGTRFEDLPEDWLCPDCNAEKEVFEVYVE